MFKYMLFDCCVFNSLATCVDGVMWILSGISVFWMVFTILHKGKGPTSTI